MPIGFFNVANALLRHFYCNIYRVEVFSLSQQYNSRNSKEVCNERNSAANCWDPAAVMCCGCLAGASRTMCRTETGRRNVRRTPELAGRENTRRQHGATIALLPAPLLELLNYLIEEQWQQTHQLRLVNLLAMARLKSRAQFVQSLHPSTMPTDEFASLLYLLMCDPIYIPRDVSSSTRRGNSMLRRERK
jgi:hypothetical protein